jgi:SAM-dependent methyltransferase
VSATTGNPQLDDLAAFYQRRVDGQETIFDVWEKGEAHGDSVTPATWSPEYRHWITGLIAEELDGDRTGVLSLGCGNAAVEAELIAAGHRVLAVDAMPRAVALARAKGVPAIRADLTTFTPDEDYSVVYLDGVLGHLHGSHDVPAVLTRIREWPPTAALILSNDGPPSGDSAPAPGVNGFHWLSVRYLTDVVTEAGFTSVTGHTYSYHRPISGERVRSVVVAR